jgi:hypothetical protein
VLLKPLLGLTSSQLVTAGRLSYAHEGRVDTNVWVPQPNETFSSPGVLSQCISE